MQRAFPTSCVHFDTTLLGQIVLPDPNDCHVVAVALAAKASHIVTYNLRDFPQQSLAAWKIQVLHPDDALFLLLSQSPSMLLRAFEQQRASLSRPSMTAQQLLEKLQQQELTKTVALLTQLLSPNR
jgi:hypothetical protein